MDVIDDVAINNLEGLDNFRDQDGNIDYDALFSVFDVTDIYRMIDDACDRAKGSKMASKYNGTSLSYYRDDSGQLNFEEIFNFFDLDGLDGLYSICNDSTLKELGLSPRQIGDRVPRYPSNKIKMLGKGFNGSH